MEVKRGIISGSYDSVLAANAGLYHHWKAIVKKKSNSIQFK